MSVDRSAIDGQLREIGEGDRWWEEREFRDLPHILSADERIHGIVRGRLIGPRRPPLLPTRPRLLSANRWLVVATNQRLICLQQERFGRKQVDVRLDQITGMQQDTGIRTCQITLHAPHGKYRIRIPKQDALRFIGTLAPLMPRPALRPPNTDLTAPAWLAGAGAVAGIPGLSGLVSRVAMPPTQEYATRRDFTRLESTVERIESELERLQQQVDFLEELLQKRAEGVLSLPGSSEDL